MNKLSKGLKILAIIALIMGIVWISRGWYMSWEDSQQPTPRGWYPYDK